MQKAASRVVASNTLLSRLQIISTIMLLLLSVQFLVGMVVNLYVKVPSVHPGAEASDYFVGVVQGLAWVLIHGTLALVVHVVLGLLLFLIALILIGLAIASRRRAWIITSLIGLLGIMAAGFNGASFMNYGHDFSSLLMSIGFLMSAISYMIEVSILR